MPKRRFQKEAKARIRGNSWIGCYWDYTVLPDGSTRTIRRTATLCPKSKSEREANRLFQPFPDRANKKNQQPVDNTRNTTVADFVQEWQEQIVPHLAPASRMPNLLRRTTPTLTKSLRAFRRQRLLSAPLSVPDSSAVTYVPPTEEQKLCGDLFTTPVAILSAILLTAFMGVAGGKKPILLSER